MQCHGFELTFGFSEYHGPTTGTQLFRALERLLPRGGNRYGTGARSWNRYSNFQRLPDLSLLLQLFGGYKLDPRVWIYIKASDLHGEW